MREIEIALLFLRLPARQPSQILLCNRSDRLALSEEKQLGFIYMLLIVISISVVPNNSYKGLYRGGGGGGAVGEKGIGCVKINSCILIADCLGRNHLALEL